MPGNSQNPTTMWTQNGGWQNAPATQPNYTPSSNIWQISNPNTTPGAPSTINDPTATGTPSLSSWTGSNGLKTTGVINPFGLTQNDSSRGYWGNMPSQTSTPSVPTNNFVNTPPGMSVMPDGTFVPTPNPGVNSLPSLGQQYVNGQLQPISWNGVTTDPNGPSQDPSVQYNSLGNPITSGFNGNTATQGGNKPLPSGWGSNNFPYTPQQTTPTNTTAATTAPQGQGPQNSTANTTPIGTVMYDSASNKVTWNGTGWITSAGTSASNTPTQLQTTNTPQSTNSTNTPFQANYLNNVTSGSLDQNGNQQYSPTNPMQFASQDTANNVAQILGGKAQGTNISGPGMGFSQPMQMIGNMNAGLAANELSQYGSQPGSYGRYLLARDQSGSGNFPSYDAWAGTQPGYNPGTRNASSYDTAGNNAAFMQNPQQFAAQNPGSGLGGGQQTQPTANQTAQQTSLYNNIYSQLAPILSLLQLLGLNGGGQQQQQQQAYQQPPPLNSSLNGWPYYSNFA